MLSKGLRDKESMRIDNVLKTLLALVFVPEMPTETAKTDIGNQLNLLGLTAQDLLDFTPEDLTKHLMKFHLNWNHLEQFADFLLQLSDKNTFDLSAKAIYIYQNIQQESKSFSFEIHHKLAAAKK